MPYRIGFDESLTAALRRIADEELSAAVHEVQAASDSHVRAVHSARVHFKKLRALLKALRPGIGRAYDSLNHSLRDEGRQLSIVRDRDVLKRTMKYVHKHLDNAAWNSAKKAVKATLQEELKRSRPQALRATRGLGSRLKRLRSALARTTVRGSLESVLFSGLEQSFASGRIALTRAMKQPVSEAMHELRKRTKDLGFQLRLVRASSREMIDPLIELLKRISDLLGDDNDLAVFRKLLTDRAEKHDGDVLTVVATAIDGMRADLAREVIELARIVYAERPAAFSERLKSYWRTCAE